MIADKLISKHKRTETGEIIVTLFEFCDLNCLFCNQDHTSVVGMNTVIDKINPIKSAISSLKQKGKKRFSINIMGGEVFSDNVADNIFEDYSMLIKNIKSLPEEIELSFVTNFVFNKTNRVQDFLNENKDIMLMSSYDPSGRFNTDTLNLFQKNVKIFKDKIVSFNVIMTKKNIEKFMKNDVPFFDYIYNNFDVYFDYYTPQENSQLLLPKDFELRDFMKKIVDKYPKCKPFDKFKDKNKKSMSCMDTFTIMPSGDYGMCNILLTNFDDLKTTKEDMEQKWFDDYNCLECEHFSRCSMGCFLSNHLNSFRTQEVCWLKEVYDHVDRS